MKISTARLKQIIHEELFYREFHRKTEQLTEVESEEMCTGPMKEASPRKRTVAGTQNLDHLDPDVGDPEEEFFGDKIDPDEVGLQTGEWTPEQFRKLMRRKNK